MSTFEQLIPQIGFLTDRHIRSGIEAGFLIEKGTWSADQLRHASYTLRLGGEVRIARARGSTVSATKEFTIKQLTAGDVGIDIEPGDTALLYCIERLRLPDTVLGFTVARGLLFAEALAPENTYVDPGFTGSIYTTITNVSERTVRLQYGMSIARLFFYRLGEAVQDGYRTGHALGIAQQLESVHVAPNRTVEECMRATDADLIKVVRLIPIGGMHAAESITRLNSRQRVRQRRLLALAVIWPPILLLANNSSWIAQNLSPFIANVVAGLVTAILIYLASKAWALLAPGQDG